MMKDKIQIKNIDFSYAGKGKQLKNINLNVSHGECCVVVGCSGCGKSTLTRVVNGLVPGFFQGDLTGEVFVDEKNIRELSSWEISLLTGNVFQDPRSQFFANEVAGEIAFGCENSGLSHETIVDRVHESAEEMGIRGLLNTSIYTLSYGMRQRVAICSANAMKPDVYVLDEPSANLDLESTYQFAKIIEALKNEGKTIIIVEHRLFYLNGIADTYVFMENGEITKKYQASDLETHSSKELNCMGLRSLCFEDIILEKVTKPLEKKKTFEVKNVFKQYGKNRLLENVSFAFDDNEIVVLVGSNGVGKSTLGKICAGLQKETRGEILLNGTPLRKKDRLNQIWYIPQDLDSQLFGEDLVDELVTGMKDREKHVEKAEEILKRLGLFELKDQHPSTLSGGQKQRLVLGVAMIRKASVIVLDEPTSGLDYKSMEQVAKLIKEQRASGTKFLIISHDVEFIGKTCERVVVLEEGKVKENYYIQDIKDLLKSMKYERWQKR